MSLPQEKHEIQEFLNSEKFIIQTCQQISKDLAGLIDFTPDFNLQIDEDVLEELTFKLSQVLLKMSDQSRQQFIYKVDLKEQHYLDAVRQNDEFQELAYLVIRRESQKVFLRTQFS